MCRQLAQQQLVWFKKEKRFHWLNMAPGQVKLSLHEVASHVEAWFRHDTALPDEWNGAKIQYLVCMQCVCVCMACVCMYMCVYVYVFVCI